MGLRYAPPGINSPFNTDKYTQMVRATIRATDESVPPILIKIMEERLAIGVSTAPEPTEAPTYKDISDAFGNVLVT
jgi:AP-2 complex subunit alpha